MNAKEVSFLFSDSGQKKIFPQPRLTHNLLVLNCFSIGRDFDNNQSCFKRSLLIQIYVVSSNFKEILDHVGDLLGPT